MSDKDRTAKIRAFIDAIKKHPEVEATLRDAFPSLAKRLLDDVLDEEELAKAVSGGAGIQIYDREQPPKK